ncbi:glycosyl transferase family 90 [Paracoccus tegillarcae]|uniref:Glycosyl transferase CAP10 domain-containing protein n=1 Tax=Paracoccus tegillarcae TaxID=1529068 RepID=A0A2K9EFB2_9RHOB|nr:glycosyl transferase family 90 [Paracoccus tegillarcae]AUH33623.1 hypothetical protein CUV01_09695 [Paracoccus tegillarcae]
MIAAGQFFHISPDWCGEERLAQIFRQNGYQVLGHEKGALAADILMAHAQGSRPLQDHSGITLFTGLHRVDSFWRPPLEAWRAFAFLDQQFPQARFILTTRDPDGWMLDRMTRDGGVIARCYAHHLDQPEEALLRIWRRDWLDHLAAVEAYFGSDPRLIRVDIDRETPAQFCQRLDQVLPTPLDQRPKAQGWVPGLKQSLEQQLAATMDRPRAMPPSDDPELAEDIAAYCLKGVAPEGGTLNGVSGLYCVWDGDESVVNRDGRALPYAIGTPPGGGGLVAMLQPNPDFKRARAEGVINDILRLGRSDPVRIDMQDARRMGLPDGPSLGVPVLCYNRREAARNVVLWPLPGLHEIGAPGQPQAECGDHIPFDAKQDRLVWRGHISGSAVPHDQFGRQPSHQILDQLRDAGDDHAAQMAAFERLCDVPRFAFIRRWMDHPDFDIGLVIAWRYRDLASHPLLAPFTRPRVGADYFQRFRYQLTLAGYDHGSNFIGAINSQSVLLKEEDGWEVYYLGRFKPWQHYIPVQLHCLDLEDKLAWARANPERCKQMSAAARAEVVRLANPAARRAFLGHILDGLATAGR